MATATARLRSTTGDGAEEASASYRITTRSQFVAPTDGATACHSAMAACRPYAPRPRPACPARARADRPRRIAAWSQVAPRTTFDCPGASGSRQGRSASPAATALCAALDAFRPWIPRSLVAYRIRGGAAGARGAVSWLGRRSARRARGAGAGARARPALAGAFAVAPVLTSRGAAEVWRGALLCAPAGDRRYDAPRKCRLGVCLGFRDHRPHGGARPASRGAAGTTKSGPGWSPPTPAGPPPPAQV